MTQIRSPKGNCFIKLGFPVLVVIGYAAAPQADGQTTQTVTITSAVPQVLSLAIDTNAVSIPFLTSDYNVSTGAATKTVSSANTLSVSSNKNWTVSLKANTAAFSFVPSAGDRIHRSPLAIFPTRSPAGQLYHDHHE